MFKVGTGAYTLNRLTVTDKRTNLKQKMKDSLETLMKKVEQLNTFKSFCDTTQHENSNDGGYDGNYLSNYL